MCGTCGCGESDARVELLAGLHGQALEPVPDHGHDHGHDHEHEHDHEHDHGHDHEHGAGVIEIETALLAKNDHLAGHNRAWLAQHGVLAVNLMSSPGSGKTSLLARTITELSGTRTVGVIEGDQETRIDAEKIRAAGAPVVQINTGSGCHLDAAMLARGLRQLAPPSGSLVFVENVGNLVCPALFDLGEAARVVVVSVTEGEDKPLKYPYMFSVADLVVINKVDLLPYVDVQLDRLVGHCRSVNADVQVVPLSVTSGEGFEAWRDWLRASQPAPA